MLVVVYGEEDVVVSKGVVGVSRAPGTSDKTK